MVYPLETYKSDPVESTVYLKFTELVRVNGIFKALKNIFISEIAIIFLLKGPTTHFYDMENIKHHRY